MSDLFPKNNNGLDAGMRPSSSKVQKVVDYVNLYPRKLPLCCSFLEQRILKDLRNRRVGFVNIGLSIFTTFLEQTIDHNIIVGHITSTLEFILMMKVVPLSCFESLEALLFKFTDLYSDSPEIYLLFEPILNFCINNNSGNELPSALKFFIRACELLALSPDMYTVYVHKYLHFIWPYVLDSEVLTENRDTTLLSPLNLALQSLSGLASCQSRICNEELILLMLDYFKFDAWASYDVNIYLLRWVGASISAVNRTQFPLAR
jgi:hypothetical protein